MEKLLARKCLCWAKLALTRWQFEHFSPTSFARMIKSKDSDWDLPLPMNCRQMLTETLPTRKAQLYSYYGPGGPIPLIPAAQASGAPLSIGTIEPSASNPLQVRFATEDTTRGYYWRCYPKPVAVCVIDNRVLQVDNEPESHYMYPYRGS